ncbi:MAG: hypothetical protein ACKVPY_14085 [Paracoccaceae bacterium]
MARELVILNRTAAFAWGFMAIWLAMLGAITWLFVRDGGMGQFDYGIEFAILGVFWIAGIGAAGHFASIPLIRVEREGDRIVLTERSLFAREVRVAGAAEVCGPAIEEGRDSEGDPLFTVVLTFPGGHRAAVVESNDRRVAEEAAGKVGRDLAAARPS